MYPIVKMVVIVGYYPTLMGASPPHYGRRIGPHCSNLSYMTVDHIRPHIQSTVNTNKNTQL